MQSKRRKPGIILWPVSVIYSLIVAFRNLLFNSGILKQTQFNVPVISVGNITVGGTGKTPHVEYIIKLLQEEFDLAVLSRGYMRKTRDFRIAEKKSLIAEIGDEPKQIKMKFPKIQVAVSNDRVKGVEALINKFSDLNAVILDDAYQHRYIKPGLSILLIDYNRPLKYDCMLPYGDLRESWHETSRAQIIIATKTPENIKPIEKMLFKDELNLLPYQYLYFTTFQYKELIPVFKKNSNKITFEQIRKKQMSILVVTGIANSKPLINHLKKYCSKITEMKFGDHHTYSLEDMKKTEKKFKEMASHSKVILTTEKDYVRITELTPLPDSIKKYMYYVPVEVKFLFNGGKRFNKDIVEYVEKNKPVNKLYK